jgi:hypothetical protein
MFKIQQKSKLILTDISFRGTVMNWPFARQMDLFHFVLCRNRPDKIELGTFENSSPLHKYAQDYFETRKITDTPLYTIINSENQLKNALKLKYTHFSFMTSISNAFQNRHDNKSLSETKRELQKISSIPEGTKRIYISCIGECPYMGEIDIEHTIYEIAQYYYQYKLDELILCDTCGRIEYDKFRYLIESLLLLGVPASRFGLQLYMKKQYLDYVENIVQYSINNNISNVVVSSMGHKESLLSYEMISKITNDEKRI